MKAPRFTQRRRLFLREWRKHHGLTLKELSDKIGMTPGNLSLLERGLIPYDQGKLEKSAAALGTDATSLLTRMPSDSETTIWSIWDHATPRERQMILDIAKIIVKAP